MTIKFIGGSSDGEKFIVDYTELTLKALQGELSNRNLNFTVDNSTIINYSYKHSAGRNTGELTENTVLNLDPYAVVIITQQPRETKARAYDSEELQEVINEAKAALISQEYKALRAACRELSQAGAEVKELIGNYTHYSISSLVDAVERAVKFLSPEVVEVGADDLKAIITRIEALETKVTRIEEIISTSEADQDLVEEVAAIKADVDFINAHFDLK